MVLAKILVGFTSICGAALALFLIKHEWKFISQARQQIRELPPEVRRQNFRNGIAAVLGMFVAAGLIFATYEWGAHTWTTRTGAALAILVFVIVVAVALTAMVVQSYRESEREPPTGESGRWSG